MFNLRLYCSIFILCILFVATSLFPHSGINHNSFAGVHLLAAARNINYTNFLAPYTWYISDNQYSLYNHHPPLFFLFFGLLSRLPLDKQSFLLLSRFLAAVIQCISCCVIYFSFVEFFRKFEYKPDYRYLVFASFTPLVSLSSYIYSGLTTTDLVSFPFASLSVYLSLKYTKVNKYVCLFIVLCPLLSYPLTLLAFFFIVCFSFVNRLSLLKLISLLSLWVLGILSFLIYHYTQTTLSHGLSSSPLLSRVFTNISAPPVRADSFTSIFDLLFTLFKGFAFFIPLPIIVFSFIILIISIIRFRSFTNTLHLSPYLYKSISLFPVVLTPIFFTALTPYWSAFHSFSWLMFIPFYSYIALIFFICLEKLFFKRNISFILFVYLLCSSILFTLTASLIVRAPNGFNQFSQSNSNKYISIDASPNSCSLDNNGMLAYFGSWPSSILIHRDHNYSNKDLIPKDLLTPISLCSETIN